MPTFKYFHKTKYKIYKHRYKRDMTKEIFMANVKAQTISNQLWAIANDLRGTMDASSFKDYILPFLFYKYLSTHQEEYLVDNGLVDPAEGESVNELYKALVEKEGLEDCLDDISSSLGYAINPEDTWATLTKNIYDGLVSAGDYQRMFENFNKNTERNKAAAMDFRGIFNYVNLGNSGLGSTLTARSKTLNAVVSKIDEIEYKDESGKDILGEIYEYLIGKFAANAGKKGGEFYTPHEVSIILAKLVTANLENREDTFTVYDPTMGSGSLLLTVRNEIPDGSRQGAVSFYGQELNTVTYNLARMNLMMHGVTYNNMNLHNADTLESDWPYGVDHDGIDRPRSFDAVVANPPYSAKWDNNESKLKDPRFSDYGKLAPASKADYAFILHSLYHLNTEGTMAIVLPHGVLFRGAAEGKIRETLIEKNYLDAVIGLPANLFYGTSIPTTILVFKKNRANRDVLFIDASNEFEKGKNQNNLSDEHIAKIIDTYRNRVDVEKYAHVASLEEIKENDYNLNIPRYVDTFEEEEELDLDEINRMIEQDNRDIAALEKEIAEQLALLGVKL